VIDNVNRGILQDSEYWKGGGGRNINKQISEMSKRIIIMLNFNYPGNKKKRKDENGITSVCSVLLSCPI